AGTRQGRDAPGQGRARAGTRQGRDAPGQGRARAGTRQGRDAPGQGRAQSREVRPERKKKLGPRATFGPRRR
ncbi:MAG: hypothetical protein RBU30_05560, partial [Polyangia bacterium]|nr:hypothetical protein [Polyangia bacterium]